MSQNEAKPLVGIVMGSKSDWPGVMDAAATILRDLGIPYEAKVLSAHRNAEQLKSWISTAADRGMEVIIAGAGGAAHLPGVCAAFTHLPVLGVPVESASLKGLDSLLSIVQMPAGIPVGTLAIGKPGAKNAALFAAAILGGKYPDIQERWIEFRRIQSETISEVSLAD